MQIVHLSKTKFLIGCLCVSAVLLVLGLQQPLNSLWLAAEILLTILALFVLGSIKYQLDKNALTYGAALVILATFIPSWWMQSGLRASLGSGDTAIWFDFFHHHFLTLHGLDQLFHADTMLFILGLTLFVCVIAQTRLLESISFKILRFNQGLLLPTIGLLTALVALASGVLDGVSMIGLLIRTMVILLVLAKADKKSILLAVMISTVITTVCGMYLAYGEPPNLIMKTNLHPYLDNVFFLTYCLPLALGSYLIIFLNLRKQLCGKKIDIHQLDILDRRVADVRFLQAARHGDVYTAIEFAEKFKDKLAANYANVVEHLQQALPLGLALLRANVDAKLRVELLSEFTDPVLGADLDLHYTHKHNDHSEKLQSSEKHIYSVLDSIAQARLRSQKLGILSFLPFVALLIAHGIDHKIPLFWASFAGFAVAFLGIMRLPSVRRLALQEAKHEYSEYLFLLPLFLSITLLQKTGFFELLAHWIHVGNQVLGTAHLAAIQFVGASALSAILDNNIVADFAGRALHNLDVLVLHLFAMAQMAGYALGGCWTHIGSAQSVVAFAFIKKDIDVHFTPLDWIKMMTPILLQIFVFMITAVYVTHWIHH